MYVFLLAGTEVFLSALVLAISNFLCMRKKSSTPPEKLEDFAVRGEAKTEIFSETEFALGEEEAEKRAREGQKKEVEKNEAEEREGNEEVEEVTSLGAAADSQEEENFLKKPQLNGEASPSPETRLWGHTSSA